MGFNTREEWLEAAVGQMVALLPPKHKEVPPLKVSVGLPKGGRKIVGQHWDASHSIDKETHTIFVHPRLETHVEVLGTVLHEVIHSITSDKHGKEFGKIAAAVGFLKPWSKTPESPALVEKLEEVGKALGPYPHVVMDVGSRKKQPTRMKLYECSEGRKIRSAKPVRARCEDCGSMFVRIKKEGEE